MGDKPFQTETCPNIPDEIPCVSGPFFALDLPVEMVLSGAKSSDCTTAPGASTIDPISLCSVGIEHGAVQIV